MRTVEELEKMVRDSGTLSERLKKCQRMIADMCKEGRPPKMSIPVQWSDEDFYIAATLQDALKTFRELEAEYLPCLHHKDAVVDNGVTQWCVACENDEREHPEI